MEFIKRIFSKKSINQSVGAIRYPERILIQTHYQLKTGAWFITDQITYMPGTSSDEEIGEVIVKHLDLSKTGISDSERERKFNDIQEKYKISTGLKTIKSQMKDAKYVSVSRTNGQIRFSPTLNGGSTGKDRGYLFNPKDDFILDDANNKSLIGNFLNLAWGKCK